MLRGEKCGVFYVTTNTLEDHNIVLDPDNVFWALVSKDRNLDLTIKKDLHPSYIKIKDRITQEVENFRFSTSLTAVYINPVDRCNSQCRYCYIPSSIRTSSKEMDYSSLRSVLDEVGSYFESVQNNSKPVIVFHGTEPLLVRDVIFRAIERYSKDFLFGIQTNGILLKKEDVDFLKRWRVNVGLSLDSPSALLHNSLRPARGYNPFAKVSQAITWFDGYAGLNVISTVTRLNVSDLPLLIKYLHRRRVSCVLLNPVRITQRGGRLLKPDTDSLVYFFKKAVDEAIRLSSNSYPIIIGNFANIVLGIIAPTARRLMCDISPCGGGRCFLTVSASGDIFPCGEFLGLGVFKGGNIFKKGLTSSIKQAMDSAAFKRVRARVVEKIEECSVCVYRNFCGAPCPAELYSSSTDMYKISPYCDFYKEIISYAFKIIAEGKLKFLFRPKAMKNLVYEYNIGL